MDETQNKPKQKKGSERLFPILFTVSFVIGILGGVFGGYAYYGYRNGDNNAFGLTNQATTVNENSAIIQAVKKVEPAVVSITGTTTGFDFFGNNTRAKTAGTGFIISKDGLILTNNHVVSDTGAKYTVFTADGKQYKGTVQKSDPASDIAIIKIKAHNLPTATIGNSDNVQVGQTVIAIGNALGQYQNTVTTGIISGVNRTVQAGDRFSEVETLSNVLQTDAVINQGNSGGPLINLNGQVIGINTAADLQGQAISFSIPINKAKSMINGSSWLSL